MHRNQAEQRATEERHLLAFLERAGLEAPWTHGDRPDFVLELDGRRVGLEHQELTEEDLASTAGNLTWLENELRDELVRRGADRDLAVGLGVEAAAPTYRRRRDLEELVSNLADLAHERAPAVTRERPLQFLARELVPLGIRGPTFVHLSRTTGAAVGPIISVGRGIWGPGEDGVVEAIRAKEDLLPDYRAASGLEEQWLLLVTGDTYAQATDSALTEWIRERTLFARVYLMDLRTGALQRVDDGPR